MRTKIFQKNISQIVNFYLPLLENSWKNSTGGEGLKNPQVDGKEVGLKIFLNNFSQDVHYNHPCLGERIYQKSLIWGGGGVQFPSPNPHS